MNEGMVFVINNKSIAGKLEIVTKNVELLGIELMQKKLNALNQTIKEVEERSNCLFDDTIHYRQDLVKKFSSILIVLKYNKY